MNVRPENGCSSFVVDAGIVIAISLADWQEIYDASVDLAERHKYKRNLDSSVMVWSDKTANAFGPPNVGRRVSDPVDDDSVITRRSPRAKIL